MNMRLLQLSLRILLAITSILLATELVRSQSGNMSDITLPSPDAMVSEPPAEVVEGETPAEVVEGETPAEVVEGETPADEVVEGETPVDEVVEGETPTDEVVEGETPTDEVVEGETPTDEVVEGETPTDEVVEGETPTDEVVEGETPTDEVVEGETPVDEVVEGETPTDEVVEGETPTDEVVEGETPTDEVVEGETPVDEVVEGETPTDEVVENAPSDTSDSNFTAQDLDIGENTTSNPNTTEGSTSDAVEPSDSSLDTEIETPDSFDSKPINTDQDPKKTPVEPDAKTTSEAQDIKDLTESSEIMEKLVEEAELREAKNSSEADEEVAQEEIEEEVASEVDEEVAQEEIDKEAEIEKEEVAEEKSPEPELGELDRVAYENQFQEAPNDLAIFMQEEYQLTQLIDNSGLELYGTVPSAKDISHRLAQLAEQTGKKPAFINISLQSNQLQSFVVLPEQTLANTKNSVVASSELNSIDSPQPSNLVIRKTVKDTSRKDLLATANQFREEVSDVRKLSDASYMASAQELYEVLIRPIEAELEANDIDILVFSMDSGLRLLPVAALHDGEQFLVEKYAMGIVPSFGLTDTRYVSPAQSSILAMGASEFEEQIALPTMPIELNTIIGTPRHGELFLNEQFTISNFVAQNSRETPFSIIHLGTHAEFKAGNQNDSYIQFYDDKLKMPQLQKLSDQLGWNTDASPVELLVLSACETALGDEKAELGFAGLAVQAGVKSALASLWYVSDLGTLALMGEFYDQLSNTLIKAEALRQTQLEMLQGNVKVADRQVKLSSGADLALPEDFPDGTLTLAHPYFWSSFTLIGNWN